MVIRIRKTEAQNHDRNRALWAGGVLALICAGGLYMAGNVVKSSDQYRSSLRGGLGAGSGQQPGKDGEGTGDDDLTTGSVLFVPLEGNLCRKRLIDNKTWFMRDKGYVICDEAVSWNATMQNTPFTANKRLDAVRTGFQKR